MSLVFRARGLSWWGPGFAGVAYYLGLVPRKSSGLLAIKPLPPALNDFIGLGWKWERVGLLFDDGKKEGEREKEDGT